MMPRDDDTAPDTGRVIRVIAAALGFFWLAVALVVYRNLPIGWLS